VYIVDIMMSFTNSFLVYSCFFSDFEARSLKPWCIIMNPITFVIQYPRIIIGANRVFDISANGIAKMYASGKFTKTSFHQDSGDRTYPIVALNPPFIILFIIILLFYLHIKNLC